MLSLFLLLLAFFILLNAISTRTEVQSQAVINSLLSTFRSTERSDSAEVFISTLGSTPEPEELIREMKRLWVTAVPVTQVEVMTDGRSMQMRLPANAIFPGGESLLRKDRRDLLRTVAQVLATEPPGYSNELELLIGTSWQVGQPLRLEGDNLEIARAVAFVQELVGAGAPADAVSIGVREGDGRELQFQFFVRSKASAKVEFLQDPE